jgi:ABC-type nitrate/sulfonate/bicarbonate transport system permease component
MASLAFRGALPAVASISMAMAAWEALSRLGALNSDFLPPPSAIAIDIVDLTRTGQLPADVAASLRRVMGGFAIGGTLGLCTGVAFASSRFLDRFGQPLVDCLRPIPPIAWIPLSILWFGLGDQAALFLVALGAFFPILSTTYSSLRSVEVRYVQAARVLGASRWLILTDVLIPIMLPNLLSGLRVGLGVSWMVVITAELVGAQSGLGYLIQISRAQLQTGHVLVGMVAIGLIGFCLNALIALAEHFLVPWGRKGREL